MACGSGLVVRARDTELRRPRHLSRTLGRSGTLATVGARSLPEGDESALRRYFSVRPEVALPPQVHFSHSATRDLEGAGITRAKNAFIEEIEMLLPMAAVLQPLGTEVDARAELEYLLCRPGRLERGDQMRGSPEMVEDHGTGAVEDDHPAEDSGREDRDGRLAGFGVRGLRSPVASFWIQRSLASCETNSARCLSI